MADFGDVTMQAWRHGTYSKYAKGQCRCDRCSTYQRERVARNRSERLRDGNLKHGTRSAYDCGCRCEACRAERRRIYRTQERAAAA